MKKRFIAGAKCKNCNAEDTIYINYGENGESLHCVECKFSEKKESDEARIVVQEWTPVRLRDID